MLEVLGTDGPLETAAYQSSREAGLELRMVQDDLQMVAFLEFEAFPHMY